MTDRYILLPDCVWEKTERYHLIADSRGRTLQAAPNLGSLLKWAMNHQIRHLELKTRKREPTIYLTILQDQPTETET